jgi:hypothetical protein
MNTYIVVKGNRTYATNASNFDKAAVAFELYPYASITPDLPFTRLNGNPMNSEEISDMGWIEVINAYERQIVLDRLS